MFEKIQKEKTSDKKQEEIVAKVKTLLAKETELENKIQERETYTKQLMQCILKGAFEEK